MINLTITKILGAQVLDLQTFSKQILDLGIQNVFNYLQKSDVTRTVYPEQVIKILAVFHYMLQQQMIDVELFQDCHIYWITNVLNSSFVLERLSTEMSSSSTFARSSQLSIQKSYQQQIEIQQPSVRTESKEQRIFSKRMECFQSYSDKQQTERHTIREPLTYQQMLQLYYTYLKKISHYQQTFQPLIDLYVMQNICSMGLRIIEGQKCPKLNFCFELILKDLERFQVEQIIKLKQLIQELNKIEDKQEIYELYQILLMNGKQVKFFGQLNKMTINQSKLKQFKRDSKDFVIECKQHLRKIKLSQNDEKLNVSEFKTENFYYERKQVYENY